MGCGIAAHLANVGLKVSLLDTTAKIARAGLDRALAAKPAHFYLDDRAFTIQIGGLDDDLTWVIEADWVIEAIYEDLEIKRELFAQLDNVLPPSTYISSNTSGLPLSALSEGRTEKFRQKFVGTHFFNPPRYLKLLELIPTNETDPQVIKDLVSILESQVARRVVVAKDTPGFIANRFGMWSMYKAIQVAEQLQLPVEWVDAITGPFIGRPRSGSFRLCDIVGIDVMDAIAQGLIARCEADTFSSTLARPKSVTALMEKGWLGDKSGHGYFKREGREFFALDLATMAYRPVQDVTLPSLVEFAKLSTVERIKAALSAKDEAGEFLRHYLGPVLNYAEHLRSEVSHSVLDFDRVMMWGFGWEMGPFALMDALGDSLPSATQNRRPLYFQSAESLGASGDWVAIPSEPKFRTIRNFPVLDHYDGFSTRDLGDAVVAISLTAKMGVLNLRSVRELSNLLQAKPDVRYVLTGESKSFSAGYNLSFFHECILEGDFDQIDLALRELQELGEQLDRTKIVAAIYGHCLGAGLELALSCPLILTDAETKIGLPEAKVGLIPGGRGATLMRLYGQISAKRLAEIALVMAEGTISLNADHARALGYLRNTDMTVYHPDMLLSQAKQAVLNLSITPLPDWKSIDGPVAGMMDRNLHLAVSSGVLSEYDRQVGESISHILAKSISYEDSLLRERKAFASLCGKSFTQARIKHMLETNRPLKN